MVSGNLVLKSEFLSKSLCGIFIYNKNNSQKPNFRPTKNFNSSKIFGQYKGIGKNMIFMWL